MNIRPCAFALKSMLLGAACLLGVAAAQAAPQALGLIATYDPVPLACDGHECSGYFTSFCLQMARTQPKPQTPYRPAEKTELVLHATDKAGKTFDLPGSKFLKFSARTSTGVDISVKKALLKPYAPQSVAISVPALASLVPVPKKGDLYPQDPDELLLSTTQHRKVAIRFHEQGPRYKLAALTAMLINATLRGYGVTANTREQIWQKVTSSDAVLEFNPASISGVRATYERCGNNVDNPLRRTMRGCLEIHHIYLQLHTNKDFWAAANGV